MVLVVKNPPASTGDMRDRFNSGLGRSPGEGRGNPLQYSCLENPMDRSLAGYSPQGLKESDPNETTLACTHALHIKAKENRSNKGERKRKH